MKAMRGDGRAGSPTAVWQQSAAAYIRADRI